MITRPTVIAIGYARHALIPGDREYERQRAYAAELGEYHLIVFTRRSEEYHASSDGNFFTHPTRSRNKLLMLVDAYRIGVRVARASAGLVVVTSQDPFEPGLVGRLIAWRTGAAHHIQLHNDFYGSSAWRRESLLNRLRAIVGKWLLRTADKVRVVSERIRTGLTAQGIALRSSALLPVAVQLEPFLAIGAQRQYKAKGQPTGVFVGRFAPEKQLHILIDAAAVLKANGVPFTVRFVGDGPEKPRLEALAHERDVADVVEFKSWTDKVADELAAADVYLCSSAHEGYGLVLIEAMASGLPIVTTDVGCVGEVVCQGEHALVIDAASATAFASSLTTLHGDSLLRETLGRQGHRDATTLAISREEYARRWAASTLLP